MNKRTWLVLLIACLLPVTTSRAGEPGIAGDYPYLESLYVHLHSNPELSFQERRTSERIATELGGLGFEVTGSVGGHGVVGVLRNGKGPTVLVRADMDALPVEEKTGLPYASRVAATDSEGNPVKVMHACGHDVHMTVLVGTARQLAASREHWSGTLVLVAQPAEEYGAGAEAMLRDGLFERFPHPDFNLALHVHPTMAAGTIGFVSSYSMAGVESADIVVHGIGGHGAAPHIARDPVIIAARIVLALQTIVSREISPLDPAVVTVGSIHGGSKRNIIPDEVKLQLTIRFFDDAVRGRILGAIRRIIRGIGLSAGLPEDRLPELVITGGSTPPVYNDPELTARLVGAWKRELGEDKVIEAARTMIGEDFARFGRAEPRIPGLMFWLGTVEPSLHKRSADENSPLPSLHSPLFAPAPEPTIRMGVKAMTAAVLELLQ